MVIRPAEPEDMSALAALEKASFSRPWGEKALAEAAEHPMVTFLVCVDEQRELLGYGFISCTLDEGSLDQLAVRKDRHREGVGSRLLRALLEKVYGLGTRVVFLEVRAGNAGALGLYQTTGFQRIALRPRYYDDPTEDAVILEYRWPKKG